MDEKGKNYPNLERHTERNHPSNYRPMMVTDDVENPNRIDKRNILLTCMS